MAPQWIIVGWYTWSLLVEGGGGVRSDNLQDFDPLGGEVGSFDFLMINNSLSTGLPHNGSSLWPLLT